jgi:hypothetical protein
VAEEHVLPELTSSSQLLAGFVLPNQWTISIKISDLVQSGQHYHLIECNKNEKIGLYNPLV